MKMVLLLFDFLNRSFMEPQHVDPEQAVEIHMDVNSNKSIGIHWGTYALANEVFLIIQIYLILPFLSINLLNSFIWNQKVN